MDRVEKNVFLISGGILLGLCYIFFWWWFFHGKNIAITDQSQKDAVQQETVVADALDVYEPVVYDDFRIVIDTEDVRVDAPIVSGVTDADLAHGVGHHKTTALPGERGNIVLSGHRWRRGDNPFFSIFENLNRLENGDRITIYYEGKDFVYEVFDQMVVGDTAVEILEPTTDPILTVYTCTPKYTALKRLVYRARLIER